jgi:hypothetical protein
MSETEPTRRETRDRPAARECGQDCAASSAEGADDGAVDEQQELLGERGVVGPPRLGGPRVEIGENGVLVCHGGAGQRVVGAAELDRRSGAGAALAVRRAWPGPSRS